MKKSQQQPLLKDELDTPAAAAADHYLEVKEEFDEKKKELEQAEERVISLMKKIDRKTAVHKGKRFEIKTNDPKDKLRVKEQKPDAYLEK